MNWGRVIRAGAWLEVQLGMEVVSIWRSVDDLENCVLVVHAKYRGFRIALHGDWIRVSSKVLDRADQDWDFLLQVGEDQEGWKSVCQLLRALERQKVKSLDRPIQAGLIPNGFTIA